MRHCILLAFSLLLFSCQENFDERCKREAEEYTRKFCPRKVEAFNTLDSTTYDIKNRTYYYWYTLSGEFDTPQALIALRQARESLKASMLKSLINSVELKKCKEEGINFAYVYRSASFGKTVLVLRFTQEDYK